MATLTLTFPNNLNDSLQIGDTAWYMTTATQTLSDGDYNLVDSTDGTAYDGSNPPIFYENQAGNATQAYSSAFVELGTVTNLPTDMGGGLTTANQMQVHVSATATRPTQNVSFILFSKDARANMSSLLGYYADVEFVNTSNTEAEIFAVNSEIVESSK